MHATIQRITKPVVVMVAVAVFATLAHAGPPSLSTNPGNLAIFPAKGQSPEQQKADEAAAYDWATQQTRWDPYQAKTVLDQQTGAAAASAGWPSTAPSPTTTSVSTPSTGRSAVCAATARALPRARSCTTSSGVPGIGTSS